jgi:arylformamidase
MSQEIWLSHELDVHGPRPPAIPAPELTDLYSIAANGARVQILRLANHTGTHLDAPAHVIADGLTINDFAPEELVYHRPVVIDLPQPDDAIVGVQEITPHIKRLQLADVALIRFGRAGQRAADPAAFSTRCPGFGKAGARFLRAHCPGLRAIGLDVPSIACISHLADTMCSHHELLGGQGRRFLIVEDMDLDHRLDDLVEVRICPWKVRNMDSGPCTVIGRLA